MRFHVRTVIASVVLLPWLAAQAGDGELLRFRPAADSKHPYVVTTQSTIDLTMGAMGTQKMTNDTTLDVHFDVAGTAATGQVPLEFTFDRFRVEAQSFGQTMAFDSSEATEATSGNQLNEVFTKMTGKPIRLTVDDRGRVQSVEGLDAYFDSILGTVEADPRAAPMLEVIRSSFSDDAVRGLIQQTVVIYPEGPVSPGDKWSGSYSMIHPMIGGMNVTCNYTLVGNEQHDGRNAVRIDFDLDIEHDGTNPLLEQLADLFRAQGAQVDVALNVKHADGRGTMWVDPASGMPVEVSIDEKMDMLIDVRMNAGGQQQPISMEMTLDSKMSMKSAG